MAPEFRIQVADLPFPHKDYIEANVPVFAPQSEYLANLQPIAMEIYHQFRANEWTDADCYEHFIAIEKSMGFHSEWLRHKGWEEQKVQDWNKACEEGSCVSEIHDTTPQTLREDGWASRRK
ncbi:hypothetical protein N7466_003319 [Penicillium verhagenii]|uniref:uncharacterized protein n=1 Tax=Penicillium verhagenii TaxID=1562060 RepID=UPI0025457637|nr:uncharacterized protein N7466_003319 [Penicillium verhagenii]KAJ5936869.1 hypothetical protein N7466_003319 [Penicillium verhagenii]